ncbi:MAG: putative bifunctional diguanylate cyclase/phosphodiesterase [Planctomycetota bacterium]|jgi:diguanylate cyclase (GGDEF)-like protein
MGDSHPQCDRRVLVISDCGINGPTLLRCLGGPPPLALADDERVEGAATFEVDRAARGHEGLERVRADMGGPDPYALVFIDASCLPEWEALETAERLLAAESDVHVIFCLGPDGEVGNVRRRIGPCDRLVTLRSPLEPAEVRMLAEAMSTKRGAVRQARHGAPEPVDTGEGRTVELERANRRLIDEVAQRREIESRLRHHAFHDTLTGLANRALLKERLERCIEMAVRRSEYRFALLFLDVDNFKVINDSLGHDAGDELLVAVTKRLLRCMRSVDTVTRQGEIAARLGGDEFVIVLEGLRHSSDAAIVCERVLDQLSEPFNLNGHEVTISASIGVAISKAAPMTPASLLRDADIAMYRAKSAGKARYALFDRGMHDEAVKRLHLENDLRRAVERGQFNVLYHPIISLRTGGISGLEALVRWDHPSRGTISPDEFIPIAEETGLIVPLGTWVMREACAQLARWDEAGATGAKISMNVNLSRRQLLEVRVVDDIRHALEDAGLDSQRLNLEITESAIISDADAAEDQLAQIRRLGVRIQMDDFGTGYSSLSCLHRFPLDVVKIDRSFLATMEENREYAAIIHGIVDIAHNLGMRVTIEGVETSEQLAQVLALDCDFAQGYLFSKPLAPEPAEALLRSERRWQVPA